VLLPLDAEVSPPEPALLPPPEPLLPELLDPLLDPPDPEEAPETWGPRSGPDVPEAAHPTTSLVPTHSSPTVRASDRRIWFLPRRAQAAPVQVPLAAS
jgi:hypothetical protein